MQALREKEEPCHLRHGERVVVLAETEKDVLVLEEMVVGDFNSKNKYISPWINNPRHDNWS